MCTVVGFFVKKCSNIGADDWPAELVTIASNEVEKVPTVHDL